MDAHTLTTQLREADEARYERRRGEHQLALADAAARKVEIAIAPPSPPLTAGQRRWLVGHLLRTYTVTAA